MMEIGVKRLYYEDFFYWTQRVGLHRRGDGRDPEDEGRCDGDQPGSQQLQHGLQRRIRTLSPSL